MKVSIVTVCWNRADTIRDAIESVLAQDYPDIEYIVVDGASKDGSLRIIREYEDRITKFVSEPDRGMYEALNKGIKMATGDIVGMMHTDDIFHDNHVVSDYVEKFKEVNADLVYANGIYVDPDNLNLEVRRWKGGAYRRWKVRVGWLPLHTTVFIKRDLFAKLGYYDESYKIASDSDLLVRYMYRKDVKVGYLDRYVVKMRMGGLSTDAKRRWQMMEEDLRMYRTNHFEPAFMTKICKMSWKVPQFVKAKIINTRRQIERNIKNRKK
ncbi:MAG: glycosyltransferase [Bacteroidaceae bacterium]|nr:glycosyltransferase [Bacteroidaceae bacterium]